jgi:hypothetical protein
VNDLSGDDVISRDVVNTDAFARHHPAKLAAAVRSAIEMMRQ